MVLRARCSGRRRTETVRTSAGLKTPSASRINSPPALRMASISMTFSEPDSARTDTAMAENDRSAPVIHSTARRRSDRRALLGIRLALGARGVEGGQHGGGGVGRGDGRKAVERHFEAPRVEDLRHDA